ncbi:hypothetical protein GE061_004601 [Apolygus lucorum]|uniref:Vitellogenin domain-containing protein n=1 Tax=Apolygus lucorum TaxID=248454 RepID=A0A8S9WZU3_APOLU|nr:hypothetical protein GE061_004601 [Apolygus lucorum]
MAIDRPPLTIGILLLVAVTYASSRECKFTCSGAPGNLVKLEPGKAYQYDLSGTTVTTKPGAKGEISKLGLNAKVEIVAGAGCENVITLSKVQTSGPDGKKYSLDKTIGSSPTKFGLQGGKLEELCVDESEHFASLNIKRAVVSLLQAALAKEGSAELTEVDVFGVCPTNLDASKSGSSLTVTKTRDLTRCSHREGINVPFTIPSYSSNSDIQTSHLLSGELKVTQKFDGGVLKLAESQEVYEYNPTSALEPQTKIVVNTKLALTGSSAKALPAAGKCTVAKPVIFDNEHEREFTGTASEITALLKKGCDSRSIDSEDARVFSSLVNAVSVAPKNEILTVYNQAKSGAGFKDKDLAVKQLLDAIYSSLSASSVEVIAELIKSKELSGADLFVWYLRLGAVKHASRASLTATLPLLDGSAPTAAYLGLGTLGARFCSEHKCHDVPEVEAFQKKLAEPLLKKGCLPKNHKDEDQLISSLKGVANMKYLTKDVAAKLGECFLNKAASTRIRSAVADTMKSDPHRSEVKDPAIAVFKDPREDSELRIKAYLVLVGCPCGKVAETVKAVLNSDQSRQVGSFVVSHLRNIRASTNPDKADAKHHLGGIISSKRYPIDTRKFSQNHELSYSLDLLNVGASAESNVIYSQQSWLPRFLSLNLTTQLYGHAINLIELDARLENVERVIESLVGPKGYANTNKPNDIVSKTKSYANNILDKIANRYEKVMRPKRSAASWSELNSIAEKVKLGINPGTDVNVDLTLKRLGAEIGWLKLHSADGKTNPDKVINEIFSKLDEAVSGAKDFDKDLRRHMTFINHDITYPTGLGLALRLKARGSAAVRVKVDGKMDLPAILKNPADTDFRLQLIPSAAIDVRGEMAIDGIAVETGVRVSLNVHSSTGTDLIVRVLEGRGVDVKVGLPVNKQEIISVKTDINTIIKEDGKPETLKPVSFDVKRESYDGCFDQVSEIIGLTFCGKVSVPWEGSRSLSPAYGPSELSLTIEKADESLSQYHFKIYQQIKEGSANFEVLYDTPGSKQDRKLSVALDAALKPKKYAKLNIYSPWTQAVVDGSIVENDHEFTALIKLNHDEAEYLLKAGAKKTKNGKQLKLEPIFEYKAPNAKSILIGRRPGSAKEQQQSFSASGVVLVDIEDQPYSRKWTIQGLSIITPKGTLVLDGKGSLTKDGIDGENKFTFGEDSVQINGHVLADGKTSSLKLAVSPSQYKDVSFAVLLSQTKEGDIGNKLNYENKLVITHGPDPNTKESKISFVNKFNRDAKQSSLSLGSQVTYPLFQVDGAVGLDIKPGYVSANVKAQADKYKGGLRVKAQTETDPKKSGNYNVEVAADAMSNSVSLVASRKVLKPTQSKFTNVLEITPGGKYELSATVTHNFGNDVDLQIDAEAKLPQEPKLLNIKTGLKTTKSECKGHFKASAGGKVYVDANGHCKKSDKPSGAYKLKLLGYIDTNGEFSYDGANLKANAKLDLPKSDRKANGKADLVMKDQKVSGFIDLCWDTKNPSKSLKIQTDSARLSGDNEGITSKNTITLDGSKTIVNGKYLITGKEIKSGKVPQKGSDSGEIEIILPSGYKFVGKGSDSWDLEGGQAESVYGLTLQEPGKGPRDMSLKIVGKNIDVDPIKFDTQVTLSYVAPDKRDAILHVSAKKVPKDSGKKWTVKGEVGSSGSLIEKPLTVKLESEVSDKLFDGDVADIIDDSVLPPLNYKLSVTLGSDLSLESNGKIAGTTIAGDLSAKLPEGSVVKSLKYSTTNIIDLTPGENKHNKLKTSQNLQWNEDKFIKAELEGICEDNGLRYSAEWETNALAKRKLTGAAHMSSKEGLKADATANLAWEGKTADLNAKWDSNKDGSVVGAHATAITPDHGKSDLAFKNKIIKEGKGWETDLSLASGDKKIVATSKIELDKEHPLVDINVDHPNGQSKLYFKNDKKGEKHWITEMKAKWSNNGGAIAVRNEADLGSIENLSIKSNLELPEHKKLDIDVNVKDGKKVSFSVKKDDKPYVSGNANYERKIEGKTKTVSGKGEVDIEGKSYPLSYVATYEELAEGDKFLFNLDAGSRKASVNILRTPEEFLWERTYCKEAGKCSKAFIKSKISKMSVEEFEQSSSAQIDFSVIDPKYHDVSYKYSYKRNGLVQDQNIELQWSDSEKIKYNAYVHENQAGVIVSLPKRTVGAELQYSGTKKGDKTGNLKLEADVWLNKEKNDKLCFIANVDVSRSNDNNVITGETKLTIPALKKDLIIKGKASVNDKLGKMESDLVVDIFRKPNQKIVLAFKSGRNSEGKSYTLHRTGSVKSEGCNLDIGYDSRWVVKTDVMQATWSETISYKDSTGAKREATASFEGSPKKIVAKVKAPEGVLGELDSHLSITWITTTLSTPWFSMERLSKLKLALRWKGRHSNFLKSKYNYDIEILKSVWHCVADASTKALKTLEKRFIDVIESLNELVKTLKQSLGKVAGQVADVLEEIVKFAQTIASLVQEAIKKGGAIAKEVSPKIQESSRG